MRAQLETILHSYGQPVTIRHGEETRETRAFLQPVLRRRAEEPRMDTPLGSVDDRRWLYIGTEPLARYDTVEGGGSAFLVKEATPVYAGETILYWHGALWPAREVEV